MDKVLHDKAIQLRLEKELSYSAIQKQLGVSKSTLSYWLRDFPLTEKKILELRRKGWTKGEASRERFRATMRRKKEEEAQRIYERQKKKFVNLSRDAFFVAGLMIYLGEGDKKTASRVALANTDSKVIRFFIKWMVEFLNIDKKKIKSQLTLYEDMNIESEKRFWENELEFRKDQFYKPTIRRLLKASFSYKESYRHGTCGIYVCGVKKKTELMMAIQAFVDSYMRN